MMSYLFLIVGLILLIFSANVMVMGASSIAKKFNIPNLVIGLTVVSFGTSFPELIVNILASYSGKGDLAIGNVVGSGIVNVFLVLGVAALVKPLAVHHFSVKYEIPYSVLAFLVLFVLANDALIDGTSQSVLSLSDGFVLISFFIIFIYYTFIVSKHGNQDEGYDVKVFAGWKSISFVFIGILGLYFGGELIVTNATEIALNLGVSEAIVGVLIVAAGTSLPELATSAVAAYKGNADMAVGNVVGSNIFNVFFVLSVSTFIRPVAFNPLMNRDVVVALFASFLLFVFVFTRKGRQIDRVEGGAFLLFYFAFVAWLLW
jgi:cation:H+ antiporter